jgi:hypothetical protein
LTRINKEEVNTKKPFLFPQEMGFHFLWTIMPPFAFKKEPRAHTSTGKNKNEGLSRGNGARVY